MPNKKYAQIALKAAVKIARQIEATHSETDCKCRLCSEVALKAADITPPQKWGDFEMPDFAELEREFGLPKGALTNKD